MNEIIIPYVGYINIAYANVKCKVHQIGLSVATTVGCWLREREHSTNIWIITQFSNNITAITGTTRGDTATEYSATTHQPANTTTFTTCIWCIYLHWIQ